MCLPSLVVVDALTLALAETLARNPGMAARLMRVHVDDGTGRCTGCSSHSVRPAWPCAISWHVARAVEIEHTGGPDPARCRR